MMAFQQSQQPQLIRDAVMAGASAAQLRERFSQCGGKVMEETIALMRGDLERLQAESKLTARQIAVLDHLSAWLRGPAKLERNEHTRLHKLAEAEARRELLNVPSYLQACIKGDALASTQVFVVRHDWSAALGPAIKEAGNEFSLPFWSCVFEFVISGHPVLIWAFQPEGCKVSAVPFVETSDGWWCGDKDDTTAPGTPFYEAWQQVAAICVALDSEVATRAIVRAPAALNKKRERAGKPAVKDFHVVDLARRHRVSGPATGSHRSPRLHFRRGHWRHYDGHNTWIRWTLVGNPDLGFVDKHYRV